MLMPAFLGVVEVKMVLVNNFWTKFTQEIEDKGPILPMESDRLKTNDMNKDSRACLTQIGTDAHWNKR